MSNKLLKITDVITTLQGLSGLTALVPGGIWAEPPIREAGINSLPYLIVDLVKLPEFDDYFVEHCIVALTVAGSRTSTVGDAHRVFEKINQLILPDIANDCLPITSRGTVTVINIDSGAMSLPYRDEEKQNLTLRKDYTFTYQSQGYA